MSDEPDDEHDSAFGPMAVIEMTAVLVLLFAIAASGVMQSKSASPTDLPANSLEDPALQP